MHIDDWINSEESNKLPFIKEFFIRFRKPAYTKFKDGDDEWFRRIVILCTYKNKRYRCTGCSRLGDVWLTSNYNQNTGYSMRVDFNDCSNWESKQLNYNNKNQPIPISSFLRGEDIFLAP